MNKPKIYATITLKDGSTIDLRTKAEYELAMGIIKLTAVQKVEFIKKMKEKK